MTGRGLIRQEPALPQEQDDPHTGWVVAVGVVTLVVFAIGIAFVILVLRATGTATRSLGGNVPRETGEAEIGIVDQPVFEGDERAATLARNQRQRLTSYGWDDRDAGTVRIPLARVIAEMLDGGGRR